MGETYEEQEAYKKSDQYFTRAVELWKTLHNTDQYAYANFRLGTVRFEGKKYEGSIEAFEKAGRVYKRQLKQEDYAQTIIEVAACKAKMGETEAAIEDYRHAEKILKRVGAYDGVSEMQKRIRRLEKGEKK
jgi:tetratricopeptide (TPR) repeat protein